MRNNFGIPEKDLERVRVRDKTCVYCHKEFSREKDNRRDNATIEHLNNDGPFDTISNVAICCGSCNSSRGNKKLLEWFKKPYCMERNISKYSVTGPVQEYIQAFEPSI